MNGQDAPEVVINRHRINLPSALLSQSGNEISFDFKNTYVENSAGLHYYKDP